MAQHSSSSPLELHRQAVQRLAKGEYASSLEASWEALGKIRQVWVTEDQQEPQGDPMVTAATSQSFLKIMPFPLQVTADLLDESPTALFDQALVVSQEEVGGEGSSWEEVTGRKRDQEYELTACILYNAGLCHHMMAATLSQGDDTTTGTSSLLKKALHFYDMALSLLANTILTPNENDDMEEEDLNQTTASTTLLVCALWNNMAHAHAYFCNFSQVHQLLDSVWNLVESTAVPEDDSMSCSDWVVFFMTSCHLRDTPAAFAIAAAA